MSDLATQHDDGALEPDEDALVSALRNQDDIPILMDVVAEQVGVSQEAHFAQSFDESNEDDSMSVDTETSLSFSQELISKTIADVLEKRLPELVSEVIQTLNAAESSKTKE